MGYTEHIWDNDVPIKDWMSHRMLKAIDIECTAYSSEVVFIVFGPYEEVLSHYLAKDRAGCKLANHPLYKSLLDRIKDEDLPLFLHYDWPSYTGLGIDNIRYKYLKRMKGV